MRSCRPRWQVTLRLPDGNFYILDISLGMLRMLLTLDLLK